MYVFKFHYTQFLSVLNCSMLAFFVSSLCNNKKNTEKIGHEFLFFLQSFIWISWKHLFRILWYYIASNSFKDIYIRNTQLKNGWFQKQCVKSQFESLLTLWLQSFYVVINVTVEQKCNPTLFGYVENMHHFICIGYFPSARQANKKAQSIENKIPCVRIQVE